MYHEHKFYFKYKEIHRHFYESIGIKKVDSNSHCNKNKHVDMNQSYVYNNKNSITHQRHPPRFSSMQPSYSHGNINSFVKGKEFVHSQTNENRGYQYQKKDYYYDNTHNRESYRNDRCTHYDEMENKSYIRKEERNKSNLLSTEYVAITKGIN